VEEAPARWATGRARSGAVGSGAVPRHAMRFAATVMRSQLASGYTGDPQPADLMSINRSGTCRCEGRCTPVGLLGFGCREDMGPPLSPVLLRGTSYCTVLYRFRPPYSTSHPPVSTPVPRGDESQRRKGLLPGSGGAFASGASMPAARLNPNTARQHHSTAAPQARTQRLRPAARWRLARPLVPLRRRTQV
jgi:hypothetical protein